METFCTSNLDNNNNNNLDNLIIDEVFLNKKDQKSQLGHSEEVLTQHDSASESNLKHKCPTLSISDDQFHLFIIQQHFLSDFCTI